MEETGATGKKVIVTKKSWGDEKKRLGVGSSLKKMR